MKKILSLLLILNMYTIAYAAPPTRSGTYETNTVISSSEVTGNEDSIFNYLQAGVDTYSDGSIVNADINASANIQSDKLNLTSIAQGVVITSGGSLTVNGSSAFAAISTGVVSAIDINDGMMDGVPIGLDIPETGVFTNLRATNIDGTTSLDFGTNSAGTVIYDNGTNLARTAVGTSNYLLISNGTSAPSWTRPFVQVITSDGTWTAPTGVNYIYITMCGAGGGGGGGQAATGGGGGGGGGGECIVDHVYTVTPGNNYTVDVGASGAGGAAATNGTIGADSTFTGGAYTLTATGGNFGAAGSAGGGAGGAATTGNTTLTGANASGGTGGASGTEYSYGGGAGGNGTGTGSGAGGGGGTSYLSRGGTGGSTTPVQPTIGGVGAGGGGGHNENAGDASGAAGGTGVVILVYYANGTP